MLCCHWLLVVKTIKTCNFCRCCVVYVSIFTCNTLTWLITRWRVNVQYVSSSSHHCCVLQGLGSARCNSSVNIFTFPKDNELHKLWVINIRWDNNEHTSLHLQATWLSDTQWHTRARECVRYRRARATKKAKEWCCFGVAREGGKEGRGEKLRFFFYLVIIFAQLVAWNLAGTFLLLHVFYSLFMHFTPFSHCRPVHEHFQSEDVIEPPTSAGCRRLKKGTISVSQLHGPEFGKGPSVPTLDLLRWICPLTTMKNFMQR